MKKRVNDGKNRLKLPQSVAYEESDLVAQSEAELWPLSLFVDGKL